MFLGQFTEMMRHPGGKAFGDRKTVSYHTVAENRTKLQLASRIRLTRPLFPRSGPGENRLGEPRRWARIGARLIAVAVAQCYSSGLWFRVLRGLCPSASPRCVS